MEGRGFRGGSDEKIRRMWLNEKLLWLAFLPSSVCLFAFIDVRMLKIHKKNWKMCDYFYRYSTSERISATKIIRLQSSGNPSFVKNQMISLQKKMKLFLKIMIDKIQ